jgi:hypothetical protein
MLNETILGGIEMSNGIEEKLEKLVEDTLAMEPTEKGFSKGEFEYNERKFNMAQKFLSYKSKYQAIKRGQSLRAINMIAQKPEVKEQYIRATQPNMLPEIQSRPKK